MKRYNLGKIKIKFFHIDLDSDCLQVQEEAGWEGSEGSAEDQTCVRQLGGGAAPGGYSQTNVLSTVELELEPLSRKLKICNLN